MANAEKHPYLSRYAISSYEVRKDLVVVRLLSNEPLDPTLSIHACPTVETRVEMTYTLPRDKSMAATDVRASLRAVTELLKDIGNDYASVRAFIDSTKMEKP